MKKAALRFYFVHDIEVDPEQAAMALDAQDVTERIEKKIKGAVAYFAEGEVNVETKTKAQMLRALNILKGWGIIHNLKSAIRNIGDFEEEEQQRGRRRRRRYIPSFL